MQCFMTHCTLITEEFGDELTNLLYSSYDSPTVHLKLVSHPTDNGLGNVKSVGSNPHLKGSVVLKN